MSILFCLFLLVATKQGSLGSSVQDIPVPYAISLRIWDPSGSSVSWRLFNKTTGEPVIGIKVKLWKTPCVISTMYEIKDINKLTKVVKSTHQTYNSTTIPDILPEYVAIVKADEHTAMIPHIDKDTWYHVRVLAFTRTAEGRHSEPNDIKVGTEDTCEKIISRTPVSNPPWVTDK